MRPDVPLATISLLIPLLAFLLPPSASHGQAAAVSGAGSTASQLLAPAFAAVAALRLRVATVAPQLRQSWREVVVRGRPTIEITGRSEVDGRPGEPVERALYDLSTAQLISYVYAPHASARQAGEAILSLSEISSRADALVRAVLPGAELMLEEIQRLRVSGQEGLYYLARYAPPQREPPFYEPPVRLLLDASTGRLHQLDVDPEWQDSPASSLPRISRAAAERVAATWLRRRDLAPTLGAGAVFGSTAAAELFTVSPNDWLGLGAADSAARLRPAWVVPFRLAGATPQGPAHALFIDAESGRVLGGAPAESGEVPSR